MEKIYNSSESESYDSEFWLDVFDEMLKSGMIDIDFLTNLKNTNWSNLILKVSVLLNRMISVFLVRKA